MCRGMEGVKAVIFVPKKMIKLASKSTERLANSWVSGNTAIKTGIIY